MLLAIAGTGVTLPAKDTPAASHDEKGAVQLNPFTVTGEQVGPYQSAETTSGSRVRLNLFEATKSIHVVTRQLMDDLGANSPLNALIYFPGIGRGTQPEGTVNERLSFRGFEVINSVLDGMDSAGGGNFNKNQYSAFIDRIEVVMGSDSVLSPTGVPGGTINLVTKKPRFENSGRVKLQAGEYNAGQFEIDVNRQLSDKLAVRAIAFCIYRDAYGVGPQRGFGSLLEGSWRFPNRSVATAQFMYTWGDSNLPVGVPIDASIGSTASGARLLPGLEMNAGKRIHEDSLLKLNHRTLTFFYDTQINKWLSTRIAIRGDTYDRVQRTTPLIFIGGTGGARDPLTGLYTPGFTYGPAPTYQARPANPPSVSYNTSIANPVQEQESFSLQNDYSMQFSTTKARFHTMAGVAFSRSTAGTVESSLSAPPFNIFSGRIVIDPSSKAYVRTTKGKSRMLNTYANQYLHLMEGERLVLNVGLAKNWNRLHSRNTSLANLWPNGYSSQPDPLFFNYGSVYKLTPNLALYHGHSESAEPQNNRPDASPYVDRSTAEQKEFGLRLKVLAGRGLATVTYFEIQQNNFEVINPLNLALPRPEPPYPALLLDRVAKGWEYSLNAAFSNELSALISWTSFSNRDPYGVAIRGTAERAGSAWLRYETKEGRLKGIGFGIGFVYQGRTAGDVASGFTAASTPEVRIPNQPSFWLAPSSIVNTSITYRRNNWIARSFIDNALDEKYIASALTRQGIYAGTPRNFRVTFEYSF